MKRLFLLLGILLVSIVGAVGCGGSGSGSGWLAPRLGAIFSVQPTGTLVVRPELVSTGYRTQDVAGGGFVEANIATLSLTVYSSTGNQSAQVALGAADIHSLITVSNLAVDQYSVVLRAFDATGAQISLDASSSAQVTVTETSVTTLDLHIQLLDMAEDTQNATFNGITVIPGDLLTTGAIAISTTSLAAPTPVPTTAPVAWDPAHNYLVDDLVVFDSRTWRAMTQNMGQQPMDGSPFWQPV